MHYLLKKVRVVLLLHDLFLLFRIPLLFSIYHRHIDGIFDLANILTLERRPYVKVFPAQTGYERLNNSMFFATGIIKQLSECERLP